MSKKVFNVTIELDIQAVTCPGVWLCPNGGVVLKVCIFGSIAKTPHLEPVFPLLYHQKLIFQKTLKCVHNLADLQHLFGTELLYAELIQYSGYQGTVLATFETSLLELLYPTPCLRKGLVAGVDVNLLMEPTRCFPGILAPKIEVSTKTTIEELMSSSSPCKRDPGLINPKMLSSKRSSSPDRISKYRISQKSRKNLYSSKTQGSNVSSSQSLEEDQNISNICSCENCCLMEKKSYLSPLKADSLCKCPSERRYFRIEKNCNCIKEDDGGNKTKQRQNNKDSNKKKCQCCLENKQDIHNICHCSVCRVYKSYFGNEIY